MAGIALRFPRMKLRGKIVVSAALIFTLAIAASLLFVLTTSRQKDVATASQQLADMAQQRADAIQLKMNQYATVAAATARTAEAIVLDPTASLSVMGSIVSKQAESVPDALGVIVMIFPEAGLTSRPDFASSGFGYHDNYFGAFAGRDAAGQPLSLRSLEAKDGAGYPWIADDTKNGNDVVGPMDYSGVLYTSVCNMIHDASGKLIGLAIVAFDGKELSKQIGGEAPMGVGFGGVLNADGVWVMNPDPKVLAKKATETWVTDTVSAMGTADIYQSGGPAPDGSMWSLTAKRIPLLGSSRTWTAIVAVPQAVMLTASDAQLSMFLFGGLALLIVGVLAFAFVGNSVAKPVARMTEVMRKLAARDFTVDVPYAGRKDELGDMSEAVRVFRENGLKVNEMTEAEAARIVTDQEMRTKTLAQLRQSFGDVVDAAVNGDFSRRVETAFADAELNAIAASINNLVETVGLGLSETGSVLSALADTDLTRRVEGNFAGAFDQLKQDTNAVAEKLGGFINQLRGTSGSLKLATGEILSGANDLSERTTKQASTIQETTTAMEHLAQTVAQNAQRAKDASDVAGSLAHTAEEGGQVMNAATEAMERITASSGKISNIIGLIDDIAFQTNLLALNASVEAARAGDAGKGFAVVAVEVRRLAQSAASASAEIKGLIEQSGGEVATGSKLVADAASKLGAMLSAARSSNELMSSIARDSREQATAIDEVANAVRHMDEMTQHNAALVEEINASIEQTESQASDLDRVVAVFTIGNEVEAPKVVRSAPKPVAAPAPKGGVRAMQDRVKQVAKSYLSRGSAAVDSDWEAF